MLYLIHGEDTSSARQQLDTLLLKRQNLTRLDGKKVKAREFESLVSSGDLFFDKKTIIIESFLLDKNFYEIVEIAKSKKEIDVILYRENTLDKRSLEKIKADNIYSFPFPKYFYQFLDGLSPKRGKVLYDLFSKMSESYTAEQVFYSMVKRIRLLIALSTSGGDELKEVSALASWQEGKVRSQARNWTREKLLSFYKKLFEIETKLKTSSLALPLKNQLDILLLTELS